MSAPHRHCATEWEPPIVFELLLSVVLCLWGGSLAGGCDRHRSAIVVHDPTFPFVHWVLGKLGERVLDVLVPSGRVHDGARSARKRVHATIPPNLRKEPTFQRRCEDPLKRVADEYTDFFSDLLDIFNGKQVDRLFDSDISIVLFPLPLIPILICYWKPEEGMESSFHLFYDVSSADNLRIESIYTLTAGLVHMFEKIAARHGAK